jgi:V/A-type H+-transporting ATPase subunit K
VKKSKNDIKGVRNMADPVSVLGGTGMIAVGAGLAIGLSAIGTAISQGALGSAALGIAAEKPEFESKVLLYVALPESILIFGFLIAILLWLKM